MENYLISIMCAWVLGWIYEYILPKLWDAHVRFPLGKFRLLKGLKEMATSAVSQYLDFSSYMCMVVRPSRSWQGMKASSGLLAAEDLLLVTMPECQLLSKALLIYSLFTLALIAVHALLSNFVTTSYTIMLTTPFWLISMFLWQSG